MKGKSALVLIWLLALSATAQTNSSKSVMTIVTTNLVTAAPNFRKVEGVLYNVEKSHLFAPFYGYYLGTVSNGIVLQKMEAKIVYSRSRPDALTRSGNFLGSGPSLGPSIVGTNWTEGDRIILRNLPLSSRPEVGSYHRGEAMPLKKLEHEGEMIWLYDYGTPNVVQVITTNETPSIR